jgi:hypothetical protein
MGASKNRGAPAIASRAFMEIEPVEPLNWQLSIK